MPERSDVVVVSVRDTDVDEPIVWSELPHLTHEDSTRRRVRLKGYINPPVGEARFELHPDYTLPNGWRLRSNGNLLYNAILGRTVALRFRATRGSESGDSGTLRITRRAGFTVALSPSRTYLDIAYDQTAGTLWQLSHPETIRTNIRLQNFQVDGTEIVANGFQPFTSRATGLTWLGGSLYVVHLPVDSAGNPVSGDRTVYAVSPDAEASTWTFSDGTIVGLASDGTYIWALDHQSNQLRRFTTDGTEDTSERITVPWTISNHVRGIAYGGGYFWIAHLESQQIRPINASGAWAAGLNISTPSAAITGVTYDNANDLVWYQIYDDTVNPNSATFYAEYVGA